MADLVVIALAHYGSRIGCIRHSEVEPRCCAISAPIVRRQGKLLMLIPFFDSARSRVDGTAMPAFCRFEGVETYALPLQTIWSN